jgi:hypothetical protein
MFGYSIADKRAVARVKKIIAQDSDIAMCSNNAAFVITLATVSKTSSFLVILPSDHA